MEETPQAPGGPPPEQAGQPSEPSEPVAQPSEAAQPEPAETAAAPPPFQAAPEAPQAGAAEVPPPPPPATQAPPPAQTQAPPPPPPAPAAAPPKKSKKKWWFIGCGCLLVLCIIVVAIGAIFGLGGVKLFQAITAPVAPIKAQLAAINAGDVDKAYNDYTTDSFKSATSLDQFKTMVEENPKVFKSAASSFNQVNINNGTATVTGTITGQDGTVTKMKYTCVQQSGQWKIAGFAQQ